MFETWVWVAVYVSLAVWSVLWMLACRRQTFRVEALGKENQSLRRVVGTYNAMQRARENYQRYVASLAADDARRRHDALWAARRQREDFQRRERNKARKRRQGGL